MTALRALQVSWLFPRPRAAHFLPHLPRLSSPRSTTVCGNAIHPPRDLKSQQHYPQQPQPKANGRPFTCAAKEHFLRSCMRDALGHEDFRKLTSISSLCKLTLISHYSWESPQKLSLMSLKSAMHSVTPPGLSVTPVSPQLQPCPEVAARPGSWATSPVTPGSSHPCPPLCRSVIVTLGPQRQGAGEGAAGPSAFLHGERCVLTDTIETFVFLSTTYLGGRK